MRLLLIASSPVIVLLVSLLVARRSGLLYAEARAQRRLRIASATLAVDAAPETNRRKMAAMVEAIVREHPDVELILFMVEKSGGKLYNSQLLIDPEGRVAAVHRKVNLQGSTVFAPGSVAVAVADVKGIRTAIIICSDIQSGAVRSRLRAEKPELILAALANPNDPAWFIAGMTAKMFDAWIVTANRCSGACACCSAPGEDRPAAVTAVSARPLASQRTSRTHRTPEAVAGVDLMTAFGV